MRSTQEIIKAINKKNSLTKQEVEAIVFDQMNQFVTTDCLAFTPSSLKSSTNNKPQFDIVVNQCKVLLKWINLYPNPVAYIKDEPKNPKIPYKTFSKLVSYIE